jgi:hypothetical protein
MSLWHTTRTSEADAWWTRDPKAYRRVLAEPLSRLMATQGSGSPAEPDAVSCRTSNVAANIALGTSDIAVGGETAPLDAAREGPSRRRDDTGEQRSSHQVGLIHSRTGGLAKGFVGDHSSLYKTFSAKETVVVGCLTRQLTPGGT